MIPSDWTESNFFSLSLKLQHKKLSELLRHIHDGQKQHIPLYKKIEGWLNLSPIDFNCYEEFSKRFHDHLQKAGVSWQEHNLLVRIKDKVSREPFLPIAVYLDNIRSAFNVGSILRTTEALRLGSVHFAGLTPYIDSDKVRKTSMGTYDAVPCFQNTELTALPRPLIGLETIDSAPSVHSYVFPPSFTILLGNEEYGLSKKSLSAADAFVQIPLFGSKNSINVAAAFAIFAAAVRSQKAAGIS